MERKIKLEHQEKTILGFWIYLMTDLIMFGALFAAFAVLRDSSFGGPTARQLFNLPFVLTETLILLTSSFICGLMFVASEKKKIGQTIFFMIITFLLGLTFLIMEISEFKAFFEEGAKPQTSAFLSSYFALVGTHGLHILAGLIWMLIMFVAIVTSGLSEGNRRKLNLLSVFWHFLDVVWIFIFTIVYLLR